jgi:hypothetical protein
VGKFGALGVVVRIYVTNSTGFHQKSSMIVPYKAVAAKSQRGDGAGCAFTGGVHDNELLSPLTNSKAGVKGKRQISLAWIF